MPPCVSAHCLPLYLLCATLGFVLYKTLGTIGDSRKLENRMAALPHAEALDLYCKEMLGHDYGKQVRTPTPV